MMRLAAAVTVLLLPAVVHAEPATAFVSAGPTIGGDGVQDWLTAGWEADGGYRVSPLWWLHGHVGQSWRIGSGTTKDITLYGPDRKHTDVRGGFLAEPCSGGAVCWFAGADLGYRTGVLGDLKLSGWVFAPQVGLDIAAGPVRVRPSLELAISSAVNDMEDVPVPDIGLTFGVSLAYAW